MITVKRRLRWQWYSSTNAHDKRALNGAQRGLKLMLKGYENETKTENLSTPELIITLFGK